MNDSVKHSEPIDMMKEDSFLDDVSNYFGNIVYERPRMCDNNQCDKCVWYIYCFYKK